MNYTQHVCLSLNSVTSFITCRAVWPASDQLISIELYRCEPTFIRNLAPPPIMITMAGIPKSMLSAQLIEVTESFAHLYE